MLGSMETVYFWIIQEACESRDAYLANLLFLFYLATTLLVQVAIC